MDVSTIEGSMIEMLLRQIDGAKITAIRGVLYFIEFNFENDCKVAYVYNINAKNEYFLQRILPYPMRNGEFEKEEELVAFVKDDVEQFRNASKSTNYLRFVETTNKILTITEKMENMFLSCNVEQESLAKINHALSEIEESIQGINSTADPIEKK